MNREIEITINDIDKPYIYSANYKKTENGFYHGGRRYAGQEGENEATRLSFTFGEDFDGYSISVQFSGTEVMTYTIAEGDREFSYDIEDTYMIPEIIKMQIVADKDGQILNSPVIYLEVKRNA